MNDDKTNLDRQLSAVRSRWIVRDAVLSLARTVLALVPAYLVLGWLDYRLDFPRGARAAELVCLVAWTVWVIRRFVVPAVTLKRGACAAALRVESVYDRFGGRLISRVEFRDEARMHSRRPGPRSPRFAGGLSASLIEAMCKRVESAAAHLPLRAAIDMKPVRRPAAGAAVTLLVLSLVVVSRPGLAGLWIRRTLLPFSDAAWPRRTQITDVEQQYRVRRGDPVRITGLVTGEIPRTGRVEWQPAGQGRSTARPAGYASFDVAAGGRFTVTIGPLLEPITLSMRIGDARLDGVHVDVVVPPELASIEAVYHYPAFTRRQPDRVQSGDVRVLVGTRVDLTLNADRDVQRMELAFSGDEGERTKAVTLTSKRQGQGSFTVTARGRYAVRLHDAYGFTTDTPATFVIDPIDNELPAVRLTRPGSEHRVTPATRLRLRFEADDDFGVTAAAIRWRKRAREGVDEPAPTAPVTVPVVTPRTQWDGQFAWDLASADLARGDEVEYHLEVTDAGLHLTQEKMSVSATHVLTVVDPESLRRSLEARLRDAFGELDHLTDQQQAGRDEVEVAIVSLPAAGEPLMPADVRRVQIEQHRQTRMLRQVGRLSGRLADVADELADSFLVDSERIEGLHALAGGLRALGVGPMKQAAAYLRQARAALAGFAESQDTGER